MRFAIVEGVQQEQIWDAATAQAYDTPGTGMFAPEVLGPTVARLAELASGGAALELAIGTGRVAVPLAQAGVPVTGIELSTPMIERLRTKGRRGHDPRGRRRHGHRPRPGPVLPGAPRRHRRRPPGAGCGGVGALTAPALSGPYAVHVDGHRSMTSRVPRDRRPVRRLEERAAPRWTLVGF